MIWWSVVVVLLALAAQVQSSDILVDPHSDNEVNPSQMKLITEVDLNKLFDKALPIIRKAIVKGGLDPMSMPDQMLSVTNIPGLSPKVHLQRGWVQEASTLRRHGDVIVRYSDKVIEFDAALSWEHLEVTYAYTLRYLLYTRKGNFNGHFNDVKVAVVGTIDLKTRKINLRFFKIVNIGGFSLKIHGHLIDTILNAVTRVVTAFSRDFVVRELEYRFESALLDKIKEVNDLIPEPYAMPFLLHGDNEESALAYFQYQIMSRYFERLNM